MNSTLKELKEINNDEESQKAKNDPGSDNENHNLSEFK